ncbi:hypothetical protein C1646_767572 [Rhizophagus diaphanus]|nr:hypothetical protein C1646_767572 [Rhizophagus diaphanus] [Rhizophagus sp. MUCL 43196]
MDTVDFFVLFDGQFHMFKKVEQLYLYTSFLNVPEVDSFIYSEKCEFNYTKPVATSFITVLNDALKCLAEYTSNIPSTILDTLQFIFDMDCREFDLKDNPKTLFRAHIKDKIDENWIHELTNMLNNLIKYRQNEGHASKYWPIAVFLLAFFYTFYYLEKTYTQDGYNPLTNDQIDRFETYLKQLSEILNEIYENLEKKQTEDFIGHLENKFVPFLKEINDLLETQLEELNNKNDRETFKAVGYAICTLSSIIATFNLVSWKKIAGVISGGIFGEKTLNKITNIQRLQKVIGEHKKVQKTIKDSQKFLNVAQKYIKYEKLADSEIPFILYQFERFHSKVKKFQTKIVKFKQ